VKTVAFPREKRTEFVGDADDGVWAVAEQVKAAVAQAKSQVLISVAERRDEQGQTCYAVISRALPRAGQAIKLAVGETVVGIFPAGGGAEDLVANTEHSTGCPRGNKDLADCTCSGILTIHRRDTGH
jgi:hypothetical protein